MEWPAMLGIGWGICLGFMFAWAGYLVSRDIDRGWATEANITRRSMIDALFVILGPIGLLLTAAVELWRLARRRP